MSFGGVHSATDVVKSMMAGGEPLDPEWERSGEARRRALAKDDDPDDLLERILAQTPANTSRPMIMLKLKRPMTAGSARSSSRMNRVPPVASSSTTFVIVTSPMRQRICSPFAFHRLLWKPITSPSRMRN
jgi:hypothetical protein